MSSTVDPARSNPPDPPRYTGVARQVAAAVELPVIFVGTVLTGGLIGAGLDHWLHTRPFGLLICGALGFAAAIRELLRRVSKESR